MKKRGVMKVKRYIASYLAERKFLFEMAFGLISADKTHRSMKHKWRK